MTDRRDVCLVVPTIRENSFNQFVEQWSAIGLFDAISELIVMEDNPERSFDLSLVPMPADRVRHYDWQDISTALSDRAWIIPRRSDTVRSFAYYMAWHRRTRYVMTLDDDCYPMVRDRDGWEYASGADFVDFHIGRLSDTYTRWTNTLHGVRPRGIPYKNLGKRDDVMLSHGLWTNVPDLDAPTQLTWRGGDFDVPNASHLGPESRIVPRGSYYPMCGMNLAWRREITPLMYHLLMGQRAKPGTAGLPARVDALEKLPFDRFGDIWCGIISKKILDVMGASVSTGWPFIRHERASDPFKNLVKEAAGIEVNEVFWEHVDMFEPAVEVDDIILNDEYAHLYRSMGAHVRRFRTFPQYENYFDDLGIAMMRWAELFDE